MDHTERLGARRPLAGLSPRERQVLLRDSGMHSPNGAMRTGNDAFEVRPDVRVEDACRTSLRLVCMAVAQFEMLAADADLDATGRDVVEGVAFLGRLACGALGLVDDALHDQPLAPA